MPTALIFRHKFFKKLLPFAGFNVFASSADVAAETNNNKKSKMMPSSKIEIFSIKRFVLAKEKREKANKIISRMGRKEDNPKCRMLLGANSLSLYWGFSGMCA